MRQHLLFLLLACVISVSAAAQRAQRVTATFRQTSMSDALLEVERQSPHTRINFIYDELQDFTVTQQLTRCTVDEALHLIAGFYPIRIAQTGNSYYVECTQKTSRHYKGRLVDDRHQPVAYANIALLSPADSSFISGGVSNANGDFVLPCHARPVVARISCVGYKTLHRTFASPAVGTIQLQPHAIQLKGVVVRGDRPQYTMMPGGMEITVEHTLLSRMANTYDILSRLPRVTVSGHSITVFEKGTPLVYVNNKLIRDNDELLDLKPADIKSIQVITSPGARYDAEVESVIRIKTRTRRDNGLGIRAEAVGTCNRWLTAYESLNVRYQTPRFEIASTTSLITGNDGEDNHLTTSLTADGRRYHLSQHVDGHSTAGNLSEHLQTDYAINDSNSIGASYQFNSSLHNRKHGLSRQDITLNGQPLGHIVMSTHFKTDYDTHNANLYYVGRVGRTTLDFNATYYRAYNRRLDHNTEQSPELGDQTIDSESRQQSDMLAGKFIATVPLTLGRIAVGTEYTRTTSDGHFTSTQTHVPSSETSIREQNLAGFAEYELTHRQLSLALGLRYEHVSRDYYTFGRRQDDVSRRYSNLFPNLSLTYERRGWSYELSASQKTHRPSYRQLRDFMQYDNRFLYEGGNPALLPEHTYSLEATVMHGWFSLTAGYKYIRDAMIATNNRYQDQDFSFFTNYNFDNSQTLYATLFLGPRFGLYRPAWKVAYSRQYFDVQRYGATSFTPRPRISWTLDNRFVITPTLNASVTYAGRTSYTSGFRHVSPSHVVNLQIDKSFSRRTWVVYLKANDIFKTMRDRWTMYGVGTESGKDCYEYTRSVSLQLTYNFNARRSKYRGTGAGNEEKKRL